MATTLDHVSGGRVVLGVGAGWQANEHEAYGLPLLDPGPRLDRLEETCAALVGLLREARTTLAGRYVRLTDAPRSPSPLQGHLPLLVGGGGERRTLAIAARYADAWHTWAEPEAFVHKVAALEMHAARLGRNAAQIRRLNGDVLTRIDAPQDLLAAHERAGVQEFVVRDHRDHEVAEVVAALRAAVEATTDTEGSHQAP